MSDTMGLEESILQAKSFLEGAANIVDTGLGIFDRVQQTINPVPIANTYDANDPGGELGGQEEIAGTKPPAPASALSPNVMILVGVLVVGLLLVGSSKG